jgi:hypothetical protein
MSGGALAEYISPMEDRCKGSCLLMAPVLRYDIGKDGKVATMMVFPQGR